MTIKLPSWPQLGSGRSSISRAVGFVFAIAWGTAFSTLLLNTQVYAQTLVDDPTRMEIGADQVPSTADHGKFDVLKQRFRSGIEVTKACLSCHTEASTQLHKTIHWTWQFENKETGQTLGKRHVVNNFFMSTATNLESCSQCHIGNGWLDDSFDFAAEETVDCLVCHDTTGEYSFEKFHSGEGECISCHEEKPTTKKRRKRSRPDLAILAQAVGKPSRQNCGACHFRSDGGDGVKHGDLDSSLLKPSHELDVHMDANGLNFSCTACHALGGHSLTGSRYAVQTTDISGIDIPGKSDASRATCESCHGMTPHPETNHPKLNDHTDRVACPTCHIPEFARGGVKTAMNWDWSTAGELNRKRKPFMKKGGDAYPAYNSQKGSMEWGENVQPEYYWFNGRVDYQLVGQSFDDSRVLDINRIAGRHDDPRSRIWPFKVMRGRQPYDTANKTLVMPHLSGRDDTSYWSNFDWEKAIHSGMNAAGLEFSGQHGFIETRYFLPIEHMVAPKEGALGCNDCHTTENGRMASLTGFYMPGRDSFPWLSNLGWLAFGFTLIGVFIHAALRLLSRLRER
jgi:octaheme c-type cytochrome (tetrathionate reductase family)